MYGMLYYHGRIYNAALLLCLSGKKALCGEKGGVEEGDVGEAARDRDDIDDTVDDAENTAIALGGLQRELAGWSIVSVVIL